MSLDEARLLAGVWDRALWLFESGYQEKILRIILGVTENEPEEAWAEVTVTSPEGADYLVYLPVSAIVLLDDLADGHRLQDCGRELLCLLTGGQECNVRQVGSCSCPFWRIHNGKYWCKHYLGAPMLLARQREEEARLALIRASGVVNALRGIGTGQNTSCLK